MHRSFSAFPDRWPGVGLLILRAVLAYWAITQGIVRLIAPPVGTLDGLGETALVASGAAMLLGGWTRASAIVLATLVAWLWLPVGTTSLASTALTAVPTIANAIAISMLGPGAFSIDARRFGPREIVIPRDGRVPKA